MDKQIIMDKYKFGEYIYNKRKSLGLTQEELGRRLGVTNKAVSKWEVGETLPDITMLYPLATVLGVSVDELLSYTDKEKETKRRVKINLFLLISSVVLFISVIVLVICLITANVNNKRVEKVKIDITSDNVLSVIDVNPLVDVVCDEETLIVSSSYKLNDNFTLIDGVDVKFTIVYQYNYYYYLKDETMGVVTYYNRFHDVILNKEKPECVVSNLLEPKMDINNFKGFSKITIDYIVIHSSGQVETSNIL